jgi:hypothetical protein
LEGSFRQVYLVDEADLRFVVPPRKSDLLSEVSPSSSFWRERRKRDFSPSSTAGSRPSKSPPSSPEKVVTEMTATRGRNAVRCNGTAGFMATTGRCCRPPNVEGLSKRSW